LSTLILMACSGTKRPDGRKSQPAHTLYDGPLWQTLKTHKPKSLPWSNVLVLSALYGVIRSTDGIGPYNVKMTPAKADLLCERGAYGKNDHIGTLKWLPPGPSPFDLACEGTKPYDEVIVAASGDYWRVFSRFLPVFTHMGVVREDAVVRATKGGIGEQRQQLGEWLRA